MRMLEGEEVIWQGNPTWRSTVSFYLKWTLLVLIPLVVIIGAKAAGQDWPVSYGILVFVVTVLVFLGRRQQRFRRRRRHCRHHCDRADQRSLPIPDALGGYRHLPRYRV